MALHLGEIVQDGRWEKQRSRRMMALHCRSRAGPVRSSLGKRVPQTRNCPIGLTMLYYRIEPVEPSKSRPRSSPSDVGQDPTASSISRAASKFSSFGIPKPTAHGSLASLVHRPLWRYGIVLGRLLRTRPNPNTYGITAGSFADPHFRRPNSPPFIYGNIPCGPE